MNSFDSQDSSTEAIATTRPVTHRKRGRFLLMVLMALVAVKVVGARRQPATSAAFA